MKVLLIDDHALFRDGIQLVLAKLEPNVQIFNASSYEDALPVINTNPGLDLLLLDLGLPGLSDIDALQAIRKELPATPVVVLSSNDDGAKVQQILNMGAQGYIPKSSSAELLISALQLVLSGGIYIPPEILPLLGKKSDRPANSKTDSVDVPLTPCQLDVLHKLVYGFSNKEIGNRLNLAESTVRVHVAAIFKALNVSNRSRAVHIALQKGWVIVEQV